jgi:hypothetical protein
VDVVVVVAVVVVATGAVVATVAAVATVAVATKPSTSLWHARDSIIAEGLLSFAERVRIFSSKLFWSSQPTVFLDQRLQCFRRRCVGQ